MAVKGTKHISMKGGNDKRGITMAFSETHSGAMQPSKLIYKGKTERSLPTTPFQAGFCLSYSESRWSNEAETLKLLKDVIVSRNVSSKQ